MSDFSITMPRGDIRPIKFFVLGVNGEHIDMEFDDIYFTVKHTFSSEDYLFQKRLSNGTIEPDDEGGYMFTIEAEDTDNLKIGKYVCDIELVSFSEGIKQTTVGNFVLTNEVTFAVNEV